MDRLAGFGIKERDIPVMVESVGGGVKVNPRPADSKALESFIRGIL